MNPLYQLDKCGTSSVAPDSTLDNLNLANKICLISMGLNQKSSRVSNCVFVRLGIVVVGLLVLMTMVVSTTAESDRLNTTSLSGGLFWSTAKEETDLMHNSGQDDSSAASVVNDHEELDGGFSSLDGMLQWAIGHSDPQKLKETAQDVQRLSPSELKKRQMEIKELMDKLKTPSDAQLMQIAIDDLNNSSLSLEDHYRALQELLILVEPIDNANDLNKLGGLVVVIRDLEHPDTGIRTVSAWVIGKASQNNALVQNQVLELGALSKLMKMVKSTSVEEGIKAFYAISALIRNNVAGQEMFYAEAGDVMLQDILSNTSNDIRLQRKAVVLVSSLAESQLENVERYRVPFFSNQVFLKSVVDLITSYDLDLQEKALGATKNLLQLRTTEGAVFKGFCGLDGALERMRLQLKDLMLDEDHKDYATDLETLRQEVEFIFHRKLEKVIQVPT